MQCECKEISIVDSSPDLSRPGGIRLGAHIVARRESLKGGWEHQQAMLSAFLLLRSQQTFGPCEPTARLRKAPLEEESKRHPEHAPSGPASITRCNMDTMGALQCAATLVYVAEEISCRREKLEIVSQQGVRLVSARQ
jgi:hypothetical protein